MTAKKRLQENLIVMSKIPTSGREELENIDKYIDNKITFNNLISKKKKKFTTNFKRKFNCNDGYSIFKY